MPASSTPPGARRQSAPSGLAGLPPEVVHQVAKHLAQADLASLRATSRRFEADVAAVKAPFWAEPAGFGPQRSAQGDLPTYLARRQEAAKNLAQGCLLQQHLPLPRLDSPLARRDYFFKPPSDHGNMLLVTQSDVLVEINPMGSLGAQVLLPPEVETAPAAPMQARRVCLYGIRLSEQPGHRALLMARPNQAPRLYHVRQGQPPMAFSFSSQRRAMASTKFNYFNRIGANGNTATTQSADESAIQFWRRTSDAFDLVHTVPLGPMVLQLVPGPHCVAVCPTSGRVATLGAAAVTCRDPTTQSTATATLIDMDDVFQTALQFSPDGRGLYVASHKIGSRGSRGLAMSYLNLFAVQAHDDGRLTLQLCARLPAAQRNLAWRQAAGGAWQLRTTERAFTPGQAPVRHWRLMNDDPQAPAIAYSTSQRALQAAYAKARTGSPSIDVQGSDLDGNLFHVVSKSLYWHQPFVYRVEADSGLVSRRPLALKLADAIREMCDIRWQPARPIQLYAQPQWSVDGTALYVHVMDANSQASLNLMDFSGPKTLAPLAARVRQAVRETWRALTEQICAAWRHYSRPEHRGARIGQTLWLGIQIGVVAINSIGGVAAVQSLMAATWTSLALAIMPYVLVIGAVAVGAFALAAYSRFLRGDLAVEQVASFEPLVAQGLQSLA